MTSLWGSSNFIGNLLIATHGFVYILGSSMVTLHSSRSWLTRCNVSVTCSWSLIGRPAVSRPIFSHHSNRIHYQRRIVGPFAY